MPQASPGCFVAEVEAWARANPQPINRDAYLGHYADTSHDTDKEPNTNLIKRMPAKV